MDRVLIQKAEAVAKTKGGIIIPEKAQSKVTCFKYQLRILLETKP